MEAKLVDQTQQGYKTLSKSQFSVRRRLDQLRQELKEWHANNVTTAANIRRYAHWVFHQSSRLGLTLRDVRHLVRVKFNVTGHGGTSLQSQLGPMDTTDRVRLWWLFTKPSDALYKRYSWPSKYCNVEATRLFEMATVDFSQVQLTQWEAALRKSTATTLDQGRPYETATNHTIVQV